MCDMLSDQREVGHQCVRVCDSASIEEMFDFKVVISATLVNYSCV